MSTPNSNRSIFVSYLMVLALISFLFVALAPTDGIADGTGFPPDPVVPPDTISGEETVPAPDDDSTLLWDVYLMMLLVLL
jgi:hypothetical protein